MPPSKETKEMRFEDFRVRKINRHQNTPNLSTPGCAMFKGKKEEEINGEMLTHYLQIVSEIARNATGSVYMAKHIRSGLSVVLKSRTTAEIGEWLGIAAAAPGPG